MNRPLLNAHDGSSASTETREHGKEDEFQSLLEKVRTGDTLAIEALVDRYQRAILRVVRARLGKPMRTLLDSMDIVQSVHRSLLVGMRQDKYSFQSPDQLIALAALMVQRKVARHWTRLKRGIAQTQSTAGNSESIGQSIEQVPAASDSPSLVLAGQELLGVCLSKLDEFDQQLVHLKLAGQNNTETAQQLGRDPAFIRMRWSRLRRTLRESGCLNRD